MKKTKLMRVSQDGATCRENELERYTLKQWTSVCDLKFFLIFSVFIIERIESKHYTCMPLTDWVRKNRNIDKVWQMERFSLWTLDSAILLTFNCYNFNIIK